MSNSTHWRHVLVNISVDIRVLVNISVYIHGYIHTQTNNHTHAHTPATPCPAPHLQTELPVDPDNNSDVCSISLSPNSGHVAVCYCSGAVAVYEVILPKHYYTPPSIDIADPPPPDLSGGALKLLLHFPMSVVKGGGTYAAWICAAIPYVGCIRYRAAISHAALMGNLLSVHLHA